MASELQRIPPHDDEAEQAVIGSMLTDKEAVINAIEFLKANDFYRDDNKTIYQANCLNLRFLSGPTTGFLLQKYTRKSYCYFSYIQFHERQP